MRRDPLIWVLVLQIMMHLPALGHLPPWSDEQYTAALVALPGDVFWAEAGRDVHPPLYYLVLKGWLAVVPLEPLTAMRLLSVLFGLGATVAFDRLWLQSLAPTPRLAALLLWASSPTWLLYARMGRSYSLQVLLVLLALGWLMQKDHPRLIRAGLAAGLCLLTDYVTGLALMAACGVALLQREGPLARGSLGVGLALAGLSAASLGPGIWENAGKWLDRAGSGLSPGSMLLGLGFGGASLVYGETLPGIAWVLALLVTVPLGLLILRGLGRSMRPILVLALLALVGVAGWVGFSFVPARVLYLGPFLILFAVRGIPEGGQWLRPALLLLGAWGGIRASGLPSYWMQQDFLNSGYVLPLNMLAREVLVQVGEDRAGALLVIDAFNTDANGVLRALEEPIPTVVVDREEAVERVARLVEDPGVRRILVLRNTHDLSPGGSNERIEALLAARMVEGEPTRWLEYNWLQRLGIAQLGWGYVPSHYLQLRVFVREATPESGGPAL